MDPAHIIPMIAISLATGIFIAVGVQQLLKSKATDFGRGVVRSVVGSPLAWDYSSDEKWFLNRQASLGISLQVGNYLQVNTLQSSNSGSDKITVFVGSDMDAFRKAFSQWKELTAIAREMTAERRKRVALGIMTGSDA